MNSQISVIITIRNREAQRIVNQVNSIRSQNARPQFFVIDYGSQEYFSKEYQKVCAELKVEYCYMYAEGLPWNKCHAINYGVKQTQTPFIVTSDVDMIYITNPFEWCLNNYAGKKYYSINGFWESKNKKKITAAGKGNYGFFLFTDKKSYELTNGYDERIVYWGQEDIDFPERLKKIGYSQIWLPEPHKIFHTWHPQSETGYCRPFVAVYDTIKNTCENKIQPRIMQNWGKQLTKGDRPILSRLKEQNPQVVVLETNALMHYYGNDKILETKNENAFIKFELQLRLKKRPLNTLRSLTKTLLKPITALTGTNIDANINYNFDYFYVLLPLLQKNGLRDYYITQNCESVYLLWE